MSYNYVYSQGKPEYVEVSSSEESALNYRKTPSYDGYGEENGVNYFYGGSNHVYSATNNTQTNAVTSLNTPLFNYSYEYDNLGRLTRKTIPFAGYTKNTTFQYADNAAYEGYTTPRVSVYTTGFGYSWRYSYDANGNIAEILIIFIMLSIN